MPPTCSLLKKVLAAVLISSVMFLSASSFHAEAPNAPAPSYAAAHPRLCNFDDLYKVGDKVFDDIDSCNVGLLKLCGVDEIYQLGYSISDVGNLIREVPVGAATPFARRPYGSNFPAGPTGRASNGNLMIDYFAMDAGLPILSPFKKSDAYFSHGVNFAVGGATALPPWNEIAAMNISTPMTTSSLAVCAVGLDVCLFHNAIFQGKSFQEIRTTLVPKVVDSILAAVRRMVSLGAKKLVVPGIYSIYYLPIFRKTFPEETWDVSDDLAIHHNAQLGRAIDKFNQEEKPNAIVTYFAYRSVDSYEVGGAMMHNKVCCGSGDERYNFDLGRMCGAEGVSVCREPQKCISWDGLHLTQEAYRIMSKFIVYHIFQDLHCCAS